MEASANIATAAFPASSVAGPLSPACFPRSLMSQFPPAQDSTECEQLTLEMQFRRAGRNEERGGKVDMRLSIEGTLVRALAITVAPLAFIAMVVTGVNAGGATTIRLETFQAAKVVIGQPNFTGDGSNDTAKTVDYPYGSASEGGGILFVPDWGNARVLGFKGIPSHNGAKAKFVLGQSSLTSDSTGDGADQMVSPYSVVAYNGVWAEATILAAPTASSSSPTSATTGC